MYRGSFYPPGREKVHAVGALDMALWDIKGKALGVPVYQLLGGLTRDHVEGYSGVATEGTLRESAQACIEFGFRAFRIGGANPENSRVFDHRKMVDASYKRCLEVREGVGDAGDWAIDFHTRYDLSDAVRLCGLIEPLRPIFVDYTRVTIPNVSGITEYIKLAAICETHYVGLITHFIGPVGESALVLCIAASSGPAIMEMLRREVPDEPHLPQTYDFRAGKLYPRDAPGLGVEFDPSRATLVLEVTEGRESNAVYRRPDGSITNW